MKTWRKKNEANGGATVTMRARHNEKRGDQTSERVKRQKENWRESWGVPPDKKRGGKGKGDGQTSDGQEKIKQKNVKSVRDSKLTSQAQKLPWSRIQKSREKKTKKSPKFGDKVYHREKTFDQSYE